MRRDTSENAVGLGAKYSKRPRRRSRLLIRPLVGRLLGIAGILVERCFDKILYIVVNPGRRSGICRPRLDT